MWLLLKRAIKIHVLLYTTYFHVPIIIDFNPRSTHQPCHPKQCKFGPIWNIRISLRISLDFFRRAPQHFGKWVKKRGGQNYFIFYRKNLISSWIFSMKEKNVILLDIWSLFVCFFLFISPFMSTPKTFLPLSDPFLKNDPRLCNPLLRHCICKMYRKQSYWTKGSRAFRDFRKSKIQDYNVDFFLFKKMSRLCILMFLWVFLIRFHSS